MDFHSFQYYRNSDKGSDSDIGIGIDKTSDRA